MHLLVSFHRVRPPGTRRPRVCSTSDPGAFRLVLELPPGGARCDGLRRPRPLDGRTLCVAAAPFRHLGEAEPSLLAFRAADLMPEARYRLDGLADLGGLCAMTARSTSSRPARRRSSPSRPTATGSTATTASPVAPPGRRRAGRPAAARPAFFRQRADRRAPSTRGSFDAFLLQRHPRLGRGPRPRRTRGRWPSPTIGVVATHAGRFGTSIGLGDDFTPTAAARLDGIGGGLCLADDRLYAGSTVGTGDARSIASVARTWRSRPSTPIAVEGAEVACLLPIEGAGAWPSRRSRTGRTFGGEPF